MVVPWMFKARREEASSHARPAQDPVEGPLQSFRVRLASGTGGLLSTFWAVHCSFKQMLRSPGDPFRSST